MSRGMRPIVAHLYIGQRRLIHHLPFDIFVAPISFPSPFRNILGQEGTRSSKTKLGSFVHRTEDAEGHILRRKKKAKAVRPVSIFPLLGRNVVPQSGTLRNPEHCSPSRRAVDCRKEGAPTLRAS